MEEAPGPDLSVVAALPYQGWLCTLVYAALRRPAVDDDV